MNRNRRDIFSEIVEGFTALEQERAGKVTLRKHKVGFKEAPKITPLEIAKIRDNLGVSRPVFASFLRTKDRTLENWEQGRSKPNDQASTLIKLVQKYPDMLGRLANI